MMLARKTSSFLVAGIGMAIALLTTIQPALAQSGLPQLDPDNFLSQIFWLVVCFGFFYLVLARIALPRIGETIERRAAEISRDLERAKALHEQAAELQVKREEKLLEARAESQAIIAKANDKAKQDMQQKMDVFHNEIATKIADTEQAIAAEREIALKELNQYASEAASAIVSSLINNAKPDEAIIKDAVDKVYARGTNK